jgi:hypothetical protein
LLQLSEARLARALVDDLFGPISHSAVRGPPLVGLLRKAFTLGFPLCINARMQFSRALLCRGALGLSGFEILLELRVGALATECCLGAEVPCSLALLDRQATLVRITLQRIIAEDAPGNASHRCVRAIDSEGQRGNPAALIQYSHRHIDRQPQDA